MLDESLYPEPTPAEVVALARLAEFPDTLPPPHLRRELRARGWTTVTATGHHLLTDAGRALVEQAEARDLAHLAGLVIAPAEARL